MTAKENVLQLKSDLQECVNLLNLSLNRSSEEIEKLLSEADELLITTYSNMNEARSKLEKRKLLQVV